MSTKERAYEIFSKMNEKQLEGFVTMFGIYFPETTEEKEIDERTKAFRELEQMTHPISDLDYDKELAEYRNARYRV
ncbi:MAG: hypothetical protein IKO10_14015 [Lachnospiraceae bacterium]|nr:hypothetical protein [Lachnospiraceae bacterium]